MVWFCNGFLGYIAQISKEMGRRMGGTQYQFVVVVVTICIPGGRYSKVDISCSVLLVLLLSFPGRVSMWLPPAQFVTLDSVFPLPWLRELGGNQGRAGT